MNGDDDTLAYLHGVIKTVPMFDNPSKISDFNYAYVNDKLVNMDTGTFPDQNIERFFYSNFD